MGEEARQATWLFEPSDRRALTWQRYGWPTAAFVRQPQTPGRQVVGTTVVAAYLASSSAAGVHVNDGLSAALPETNPLPA